MQDLPPQVIRAAAAALLFSTAAAAGAPAAARPGREPVPRRTFTPWDQTPPPSPAVTPELIANGSRIFRGACVGCHGENADGQGREGKLLQIPPRNFTVGQFMCRTTPSGSLPLDTDLFRSIRRGFKPQVGMPPFLFLSDREVWSVIAYIKTRSQRWTVDQVPPPLEIPPPPPRTVEMIKAGAEVFKATGCAACHGATGNADGPSAAGLTYDNEMPVLPANFHKPADFKCGSRVTDIFRTISTGMDGAPMPAFVDALTVEQRWQLAWFIHSVGDARGMAAK